MAKITELTFKHKGKTYSLDIDFDDEALMEDDLAFDLFATRTGGRAPDLYVNARVQISPSEETITISVQGETVFEGHIFETESTFEDVLDNVPAELFGDRITGCAIRAGVSSIIGQAINCARGLEEDRRWRLVTEYLECMRNNFSSISSTTMYRAFRCVAGSA